MAENRSIRPKLNRADYLPGYNRRAMTKTVNPPMSGTSATLHVTPLAGSRELKQFLEFPARLYQDDPCWVHPLLFEQRQQLSPRHPVFQHLTWQAWLALRGGRIVGRIAAQVDALHQKRYQDASGFFGLYESENDPEVPQKLFKVVETWLREQGMRRLIGPFNLNINAESGLLVDGFDTPPSMMMGHAMPCYEKQFIENGLHPVKDMLAYRIDPRVSPPPIMTRLAKKVASRVRVRCFDRRRKDEEFELLRDIFNDAWSGNWNFLPFTQEEFAEIGNGVAMLVSDDFIQIAELDSEPVAFVIAMPNLNEILARMKGRLLPLGWLRLLWGLKVRYPKSARVPLMGVRQACQHTRFGPALAFVVINAVREAMIRKGIIELEMSWILKDNSGMRNIINAIGGEAYKTYRMFDKSLEDA